MDAYSTFLLVLGFVTFGVGGLARTKMNSEIRKLLPSYSKWSSTEIGYWRLVKERRAPTWPLFVTLVCMPMGVAMVFAGVIVMPTWQHH